MNSRWRKQEGVARFRRQKQERRQVWKAEQKVLICTIQRKVNWGVFKGVGMGRVEAGINDEAALRGVYTVWQTQSSHTRWRSDRETRRIMDRRGDEAGTKFVAVAVRAMWGCSQMNLTRAFPPSIQPVRLPQPSRFNSEFIFSPGKKSAASVEVSFCFQDRWRDAALTLRSYSDSVYLLVVVFYFFPDYVFV